MTIIPIDPLFLPPKDSQSAALNLLKELRPDIDESVLRVSETPKFFDGGGNFESIFCPFCATEIVEWWKEQMDRWWDRDRRFLTVETPCCHRATSLNDLDYVHSQGFACFGIELMNPGLDLEPAEREQVEAALGTPVRLIWRHL